MVYEPSSRRLCHRANVASGCFAQLDITMKKGSLFSESTDENLRKTMLVKRIIGQNVHFVCRVIVIVRQHFADSDTAYNLSIG